MGEQSGPGQGEVDPRDPGEITLDEVDRGVFDLTTQKGRLAEQTAELDNLYNQLGEVDPDSDEARDLRGRIAYRERTVATRIERLREYTRTHPAIVTLARAAMANAAGSRQR